MMKNYFELFRKKEKKEKKPKQVVELEKAMQPKNPLRIPLNLIEKQVSNSASAKIKDINVLHLKQRQKFVKALRKMDIIKKTHLKPIRTSTGYFKQEDPLVESIRKELESVK